MKEMLVVGVLETPDSDYLVSGGDLDFVFVVLVVGRYTAANSIDLFLLTSDWVFDHAGYPLVSKSWVEVDSNSIRVWVHLEFLIGHRLAGHIIWVSHLAHDVVHFHAEFQLVDPCRDHNFLFKLDLLFFILTDAALFKLS